VSRDPTLPEFEAPPVTEVILGVQFQRISALDTPRMVEFGDAHYARGGRRSAWSQQPHVPGVIERFGVPARPEAALRLSLEQAPPRMRVVFILDEEETCAVQLQDTALIRNWRKVKRDHLYPRFESIIADYERDLERLAAFVAEQEWGELRIVQAEVTYLNLIPAEGLRVSDVFVPWTESDLGEADTVDLTASHRIDGSSGPVGRLHVNLSTGWSSDREALYVLSLTARGAPEQEPIAGALDLLRVGRERIVRGFTALTTPKMHALWRRTDGAARS
jgi:uncharacterized protein (TIGR04255 family)